MDIECVVMCVKQSVMKKGDLKLTLYHSSHHIRFTVNIKFSNQFKNIWYIYMENMGTSYYQSCTHRANYTGVYFC